MTPQHGLDKRPDAPPQDGLHIAGMDGEFCDVVQSDHPRCPECQALLVGADEDRLCYGCRRAYEQAEEASERAARWKR